jgi:hypothetical protein
MSIYHDHPAGTTPPELHTIRAVLLDQIQRWAAQATLPRPTYASRAAAARLAHAQRILHTAGAPDRWVAAKVGVTARSASR